MGRRISRRGMMELVGRLALGIGGAAASGVSQAVLRSAKASDATGPRGDGFGVATDERPFVRDSAEVHYWTDHVSGARGAALSWGLNEFVSQWPHIVVRAYAATAGVPTPPLELSAMSHAHVALLAQADFVRHREMGRFMRINDLLAKLRREQRRPEPVAPEYFVPDVFTDDRLDHSFPLSVTSERVRSPDQFGMPFELSVSGFLANISLADSSGVRLPDSENSWTWDDWTEWDAMMTDPETSTYGTWSRDDYAGQYMPQMYTNGLKKPFDDGLTKTMFDQPEALEAWTYLIDKVVKHKTAPSLGPAKMLAGEYDDPSSGGKIGIWPTDQVSVTGHYAPQIRDRFAWTLLPAVVAPRGGPPGHSWSMRANLVLANAHRAHEPEAAVAFVQFLAGPVYQGRVGIDRGHVPVHKAAIDAPESRARPPHGMKWLKVYADRPDNRSPYPFEGSTFWWRYHNELARRGWSGQMSAEDSLAACQGWSERYFRFYYDGPRPYVREPVYP